MNGRHTALGCPITCDVCAAECAVTAIMEHLGVAAIVLEPATRTVAFANRAAHDLAETAQLPLDFEGLTSELVRPPSAPLLSDESHTFKLLQLGSRSVGFAVHENSDGHVWIFLRDVTDRTRLELVAADAEAASNLINVLSTLRHEIGNHLNSLKVALTVLTANIARFPQDKVREYLDRSLSEIARMEALFRSFKTLAIYDRLALEDLDLRAFLTRFCDLIETDVTRKGVRVERRLGDQPCSARTDPRALQELLLAILANAVDALAERDQSTVSIALLPPQTPTDRPAVRLADNGPGIPTAALKQVFEPFFTTKPKGSGMGLVIAERLAAMIGAKVALASEVGRGTEVTVSLLPTAISTDRATPAREG
jgi:signal transduction histidine kinase